MADRWLRFTARFATRPMDLSDVLRARLRTEQDEVLTAWADGMNLDAQERRWFAGKRRFWRSLRRGHG